MIIDKLDQHPVNHHHDQGVDNTDVFGFWIYLMSDCALFGALFATYAVLHNNTFGGPDAKELFSLRFVLIETLLLLSSSFTFGLVTLAMHKLNKAQVLFWLAITFILGCGFVWMEISEFSTLFSEGNGWNRSGFLSAFFTLVGTHGLHVSIGLLWMLMLSIQISISGFTGLNLRKLVTLGLFWHFLDIVWIFVFSIVYLLGAV